MSTVGLPIRLSLSFALLILCSATSSAETVSFTGTTVGGPTFNRPVDNGNNPPTSLSNIGTAVRYSLTQVNVTVNGLYSFSGVQNYDGFLVLYRGSFTPSSPLFNVVIANDDNLDFGTSGFSANLASSTNYFLVTAGTFNSDFGTFTNTVTGPGLITLGGAAPIPEPATLFLLGLGLVGIVTRTRGRLCQKDDERDS